MGSTFHEVSLTYFSWKYWNFSEESNFLSFCGLFEIHYSLSSSMIPFSPFSSLPFHSTPVSCQIWMILKGNISHQRLIVITKIDPTWCLQIWRVRLQLSCTPQGWCGNTIPFALHSPSLKRAQPARSKNFYSPGFNWASSYAFFHFFNCVSKATGFRGLKSFEKNTFHLILCLQNACSDLPLSSCLLFLIQLFLLCL